MSTGAGGQARRVLLGVADSRRERELRDGLTAAGLVIVERCLDGPSVAERALRYDSDVALVASDLHQLSVATLGSLREARVPVVMLADSSDHERFQEYAHLISSRSSPAEALDAVRRALELGVSYASAPAEPLDSGSGSGDSRWHGDGKVLALVAGKGAPGVTTVAIGLAAALSDAGRDVVLVDADVRAGNAVSYLDLNPAHGILGLAASRHDGSGLPLEDELQDGPGFRVLAGLERPENHGALRPELAVSMLVALREQAGVVLVDAGQITAATLSPFTEALLRQADGVLLVCTSDLTGAWNARCCLRHLVEGMALPLGGVALVINRHERGGQYDAAEMTSALGTEVLGVVPEDRTAARRAAASQVPITAAGGRVRRSFHDLAAGLSGQARPAPRSAMRRWPIGLRATAVGRR
jgi:MinD-like ATPase involved in chromosome partitioning or flagellar assembly